MDIPEVIVKRKPIILYTKATEGTCWITVRFWSTIINAEKIRSEAIQHLNIAFSAQGITDNEIVQNETSSFLRI